MLLQLRVVLSLVIGEDELVFLFSTQVKLDSGCRVMEQRRINQVRARGSLPYDWGIRFRADETPRPNLHLTRNPPTAP